ncbi:MAG: hypothetical protein HZC24_13745 [Rhodocyclales bacterium]|nr:hypothetical protein [Rhodocyclales bacterium]
MALAFVLTPLPVPAAAQAPYPTADRVEYVLECMRNNGGRYDYLYKCSCAIDAIAQQLSYDDYVDAAAVARYQGMAGERMGAFRDPPPLQARAARYRALQTDAKKTCDVPR